DRHCYCLDRHNGRLRWQKDLGGPIAAALIVAGTYVFATSESTLYCLETSSGAILWQFDMGKHSQTNPQIVATPAFDPRDELLYLGAGLHYAINSAASVYCLKAPAGSGNRK